MVITATADGNYSNLLSGCNTKFQVSSSIIKDIGNWGWGGGRDPFFGGGVRISYHLLFERYTSIIHTSLRLLTQLLKILDIEGKGRAI